MMGSDHMQSLRGKRVLVTGASSGIGRAAARAFAREGMHVAVTARSVEKLHGLANELASEMAGEVLVLPADLTSSAEVDRLVDAAIKGLGRLDVLFANAGVYAAGNVIEGNPDEWEKLLALNVSSVFRSIRRALPHMREMGGGDILVTSSISAHLTIPLEPVYSASKHAVNAFLNGLRRQVVRDNIRVGSIAPGTVLNELWGYTDPAEIERKVAAREGLRSEDIADAAVFMLSRPAHVAIRDLVVFPQALDI
jgi:ribitol 2-dehydrogenase